MDVLASWVDGLPWVRGIAVSSAVVLVCLVGFSLRDQAMGGGKELPDRKPQSRQELAAIFDCWADGDPALGRSRRRIYAGTQLTLDMVFPAAYGLLGALLLSRIVAGSGSRWLVAIPLGAALADAVENILLAGLAYTFDGQVPLWGSAVAAFTALKWALLITTMTLIVLGSGLLLAKKLRFSDR